MLPFPGMFAIIISPNPIITVLAAVSFMLASLQITCNCYIGVTRIMVGMSLDRTLPAWFSKVNSRFRTPVNAHLIYFILGVGAIVGYSYVTKWYTRHARRDVRLRLRVRAAAVWRPPCCPTAPRRSTRRRREPSTSSPASRW